MTVSSNFAALMRDLGKARKAQAIEKRAVSAFAISNQRSEHIHLLSGELCEDRLDDLLGSLALDR